MSSGVNMDNIDKLPSPSDSGTVSPNNERINGDGNEAINGKQLHLYIIRITSVCIIKSTIEEYYGLLVYCVCMYLLCDKG